MKEIPQSQRTSAMKEANNKNGGKRDRQDDKPRNGKGPKQLQPKTGAPRAAFLTHGVADPADILRLRLLVESSRKEREAFRSLPTDEVSKQLWWGLLELAERVMRPRLTKGRLENAAGDLALIATAAARFLEDFARSNLDEEKRCINMAARRKSHWPVLLRLGSKRNRRGGPSATLEGADKAKAYLRSIQLGQDAPEAIKHIVDPNATPFKRTAAWFCQGLFDLQQEWRGALTPWARRLYALDLPMTGDNVEEWWSVAKEWIDEQWETNRDGFRPLIAACKSKGKSLAGGRHELYESEVRRNVIDVRLKEAFFALAKPARL
jgi:hypothetical protein